MVIVDSKWFCVFHEPKRPNPINANDTQKHISAGRYEHADHANRLFTYVLEFSVWVSGVDLNVEHNESFGLF